MLYYVTVISYYCGTRYRMAEEAYLELLHNLHSSVLTQADQDTLSTGGQLALIGSG